MTFEATPLDPWAAREEAFDRSNARAIRDGGYASTEGAQAIIRKFFADTAKCVRKETGTRRDKEFLDLMADMPVDTIALVALTGGIDAVAADVNLTRAAMILGRLLEAEVWAQGLYHRDAVLARNLEKLVSKRHGRVKDRKTAIRKMAQLKGYSPNKWTYQELLGAGNWLINILVASPVFTTVTHENSYGKPEIYLAMTEEALAVGVAFVQELLEKHPVHQPTLEKPAPWKGPDKQLKFDGRSYTVPLVRKKCKVTQKHIANAIKSGRMDGVLESLNAIESVAWSINGDVLEVLEWAYENEPSWDIEGKAQKIAGLPPKSDLDEVHLPEGLSWDDLDDDQRKAIRIARNEEAETNRGFIGQRRTMDKDLATAKYILANGNKFFTAVNLDYRGRIYYLPQFNFQRQDYVRSLFTFNRGEPLGERGLYWLKVHVANTGAFNKIDKAPFDDRVKWVHENFSRILDAANDPKASYAFWGSADSPFMFLAAAMELRNAYLKDNPYEYVCSLPVSFDGSCSGLQHLAAMTKCADTAPYVNIVPTPKPSDIYQTVWDRVLPKFERDAEHAEDVYDAKGNLTALPRIMAAKVLAYGGGRGLVKRNVMVYSYGSKRYGMADQHQEDLMKPLKLKVMRKEIAEHPFAMPQDKYVGQSVCKYLAGHIFDTIEDVVKKPAEAMVYLQKIAKALAHEGKPVVWHTPLGLPVVLLCPNERMTKVRLYLHDKGVKSTVFAHVQVDAPGISKAAASNAIAPGFVHSFDACHLQLVANRSIKDGIRDLAFVHDSFGCLPSKADAFRGIILDQFYWLYSFHDVLGDILKEAHEQIDTNHDKLPEPFVKGTLNIEEILDATYAFA